MTSRMVVANKQAPSRAPNFENKPPVNNEGADDPTNPPSTPLQEGSPPTATQQQQGQQKQRKQQPQHRPQTQQRSTFSSPKTETVEQSPPPQGSSRPRSSSGLSELARQLRTMQAQNESLVAEVRRLERQLKIALELSGVSVKDLQATLAKACESEAHGELRLQLAKLQAQLEESRQKQQVGAANNKKSEFDQDKDAKRIANLELRIGELEETEQNLRTELAGLYKSQQLQQAKTKKSNKEPKKPVAASDKKTSMKKDSEKEKENQQIRLLQSQVEAREKDLELLKSQCKARFSLQDGRITDLEQQLSSLYVAFDMVDSEHQSSKAQLDKLSKQLHMADSQVAKAVLHMEQRTNKPAPPSQASQPPTPNYNVNRLSHHHSVQTATSFVSDDSSQASSFALTRANSVPAGMVASASSHSVLTTTASEAEEDVVLVQGVVNVRYSGRLGGGGWKQKYAKVRRSAGSTVPIHYELVILASGNGNESPANRGRKRNSSEKMDVYALIPQQSAYNSTQEFAPQHPFCFRIHTDPFRKGAPSVTLASPNEGDFDIWMVALQEATQQLGETNNTSITQQRKLLEEHRQPMQDAAYNASLQAAMRESLREHRQRSSTSLLG